MVGRRCPDGRKRAGPEEDNGSRSAAHVTADPGHAHLGRVDSESRPQPGKYPVDERLDDVAHRSHQGVSTEQGIDEAERPGALRSRSARAVEGTHLGVDRESGRRLTYEAVSYTHLRAHETP